MLVVLSESEIQKYYDGKQQFNVNGTEIILGTDIEDVANRMTTYLDGRKADNVLIDIHGGVPPEGDVGTSQFSLGTTYEEGASQNAVSIDKRDIFQLANKKNATNKITKEKMKDVKALIEIANNVNNGGTLVIAGCEVGVDRGFAGAIISNISGDITIFTNQDPSRPYVERTDGAIVDVLITTEVAEGADFNSWGGWIKTSKSKTEAVRNSKTRSDGNIRVSIKEGLIPKETTVKK